MVIRVLSYLGEVHKTIQIPVFSPKYATSAEGEAPLDVNFWATVPPPPSPCSVIPVSI